MMKIGRFAITIMALTITSSVSAQDFDKKNLLYRINSVENKTVELLGFEKKPKEELVIPNEVSYKGDKYAITTIAENAFKDCEVLKSVIGPTIQIIKDGAFQGCVNLSTVTFTDQLSEVKNNAFRGCTSLSQASLGNEVQTIGDAAFAACTSLTELSFGSSLKSLGVGVINGTKISSVVLPNSLVRVGHHAFADCSQLSSVTFGNALKVIDNNAFERTALSSIVFPNSLLDIGDKAFSGCSNLKMITFGNSLKDIGVGAFQGVQISSLSFPTSLKIVKNGAFKDCISLQSISFNDNIETIEESAFGNCSLLSIDLTDCMADVANNAFYNCKNVKTSNYSLKGIANYLKNNVKKLVNMPNKDRENIESYINDQNEDVCVLGTFEDGFAFFHYKDGNILKCDVVTIFGKVISQNGGEIVAENLIMVPSDNGRGVVLKDVRGKTLTKNVYDDIYQKRSIKYVNGYLQVCLNNKYGFIDKSGNEVVPCKYSSVDDFNNDIAKVWGEKNEKYGFRMYGFVNKEGKEILPCLLMKESHSCFENGYEVLMYEGKYGIVDKDGNKIVPFNYDYICNFSEGLAAVVKEGKLGFVDKTGSVVIPLMYDIDEFETLDYAFNDGLAFVKKNGKWGYIDKSNNVVIPFEYNCAEAFHGGIARVINTDGKERCIDKKGKVVLPFIDSTISYQTNGIYMIYMSTMSNIYNREFILFNKAGIIGKFDNFQCKDSLIIVEKNKKYGAIDYTGKVLVPCIYKDLGYNENILKAKDDNGKYIFNKNGEMIISSDYEIGDYYNYYAYEGILKVKKNGLYGYVENTGKTICPLIYDDAEDFRNGFAKVCKGGLWGVIDKKGKEIIPCIYQMLFRFSNDLAIVVKSGNLGVVDIKGNSTFDNQ